ncbi:hypothetical protein Halar_3101 [halophilic archaeon DL31]|jgi:hypothetical protein|nr:hypothetical protein Halar_3101 [halophilic archaeon DL31]
MAKRRRAESGRGKDHFPQIGRFRDQNRGIEKADSNELIQAVDEDCVSDAVQQLAQVRFAGLHVVDAISEVKQMVDAGTGWIAREIQAAIEEAGFDFDVEQHVRSDFEIPETGR